MRLLLLIPRFARCKPRSDVIALIIAIVLAGCQGTLIPVETDASLPTEITASATATETPTLAPKVTGEEVISAATPIPTASPTFPPTPTEVTCQQEGGRVEISELETDLLRQPLEYRVYLPPCYDVLSDQRFPVLYLIHGQSFNDDQWERLGAPEIVDRLVASGELPPFIIVMPRDRIWQEPADDPFGQALVETLIPFIDSYYRTIPERASRAVGGLSRGGAWALHLGLSNWETFGTVGMHSGFAFQSDIAYVKRWLDAIPLDEMPRFYLDVSDNDRPEIAQSAAWFERLLTARGIPHEWYLFPGYHDETYWSAHLEQYLRWYADDWK